MNISEELIRAISPNDLFTIDLFGMSIPVSDTVVVTWLVMLILIAASVLLTRGMKRIPEGKQNFIEWFVGLVNNFTKNNTGHHWQYFAPYLGTILLFLVTANIISVFNIIPSSGELYSLTGLGLFKGIPEFQLRPPTKDINVTSCMAIMSILLVLISGILVKRPGGFLKSFLKPLPIMAPFKVLDYFIRPLSLCFRLFGNILGALIIMELLYAVLPLAIPAVLGIYFDLFDGILQAYIFVFLTSLYIGEAVE